MTRSESARIAAVVAAILLVESSSSAQETGPDPLVPFEEGRSLVRSGRYAEALGKFEESIKLKPTSGAMINVADCYEKLGRYASAVMAFDRAAKLAEENGQSERAKEATDRRVALEPIVSHLTVNADGEATVTLDGEPVDRGQPLAVDAGEHVVRITMHCRAPKEQRVSVGVRGDDKSVSLEPGPRSEEPACGGPPPTMRVVSPAIEPSPSSWSTQKTVALVMGGASLVALGAGIGFGLSASAKKDELESACGDYPNGCPIDRRDELETTYDDASRSAAYSTLGIVAGVVFLGAAVGLYLTAPKTSSRIARSALRVDF
jgi:tetratricopeptide (TPR) repeat protein